MTPGAKSVLFYRNFKKFHGGHLNVWEYFNHVRAAPDFEPRIAFSQKTSWDESNPWSAVPELVSDSIEDWNSVRPDIFFVAGRDWVALDQHPDHGPDVPVVNLLQHVRHADPGGARHEFLSRRAIRICVSEPVADAVRATGLTRGPVIVIPSAVELRGLPAPKPADTRSVDVLVAGLKQPKLGAELRDRLTRRSRRVELLDSLMPRDEYLRRVVDARVTVFLPNEGEGFYLPPLEGMGLGTIVVCPEHDGGQAISQDGANGFRPKYELEALAAAAESALELRSDAAEQMRAAARATAESHSPERERASFLEILRNVDRLWTQPA